MSAELEPIGSRGWALVTGGARRVGAAFSAALANRGFDLVIHSRTEEKEGIAEDLRGAYGVSVLTVGGDLSTREGVQTVVSFVLENCSSLAALINNASHWVRPGSLNGKAGLNDETFENFDYTIAVNLRAPFFLVQGLLPVLERHGDSFIVNVLDRSVSSPYLTRASHSMSKAALAHLVALSSRSLPAPVRCYGLELDDVLPADELPAADLPARRWRGAEDAAELLIRLLEERPPTGTILVE